MDQQLTDIDPGISENALKSFKAVLSKPGDIYKLFFLFTKRLNKFFQISRSSLIIYSKQDNKLKVIAMKGLKGARKGLTLTLPENNSLLYKIFEDGQFYIQHNLKNFEGNFIEEKILKDRSAQSLVVLPIRQDNKRCGLVCFSSPNQNAFTAFESSKMNEILDYFGKNLIIKIPTSCV